MTSLLEARNVSIVYGASPALREASLSLNESELVAVIGPNGAGKSTLLRSISRMVRSRQGSIFLDGSDVTRCRPNDLVRMGVAHAPEGRHLFGPLTVLQNLELGAFVRGWSSRSPEMKTALDKVYDLFPALRDHSSQAAQSLSGGEQQMVTIGRALMSDPRVLMLDEPSLGLAPMMVDKIYESIRTLCTRGIAVLLIEQDAAVALDVANRAYVLQGGRVVLSGIAGDVQKNPLTQEYLLGATRDLSPEASR